MPCCLAQALLGWRRAHRMTGRRASEQTYHGAPRPYVVMRGPIEYKKNSGACHIAWSDPQTSSLLGQLGFGQALPCCAAGANDFSETLMEENISKSAGATFGEYISPEEWRAMIRSIRRISAERTTTYKIRQIYGAPENTPFKKPARLQLAQTEKHVPYTERSY